DGDDVSLYDRRDLRGGRRWAHCGQPCGLVARRVTGLTALPLMGINGATALGQEHSESDHPQRQPEPVPR
ncbi:MAG: hypothetical protein V3W06_06125, partial [Acidimicrobiia bacterium]